MISRTTLSLLFGGLVLATAVEAGPIFSGPATITSTGGTLVFDLLAGGDLSSLDELPSNPADFDVQVISTVWSFDPPPNESGTLNLGATLALAGMNSGLHFNESIDLADETGNVIFSNNVGGPGGLPFSEDLAMHLLSNAGQIFGNLIPDPGTEDAWDAYFATGASLTNYLFIELSTKDTSTIPEPAAVLVWGAIGLGGLVAHRRWRRRSA